MRLGGTDSQLPSSEQNASVRAGAMSAAETRVVEAVQRHAGAGMAAQVTDHESIGRDTSDAEIDRETATATAQAAVIDAATAVIEIVTAQGAIIDVAKVVSVAAPAQGVTTAMIVVVVARGALIAAVIIGAVFRASHHQRANRHATNVERFGTSDRSALASQATPATSLVTKPRTARRAGRTVVQIVSIARNLVIRLSIP